MNILITESQYNKIIKEEESHINVRHMTRDDIMKIIPKLEEVFYKTNLPNKEIWEMVKPEFNIAKSSVITVNGVLAGFYFIGNNQIPDNGTPLYEKLKPLMGVEGVALGVFPEYKDTGIGKKLIEWSQKLPIDYIWGYQLKSLENINDWKKRREVYFEDDELYITYQLLNKTINLETESDMDEVLNKLIHFRHPGISEFN